MATSCRSCRTSVFVLSCLAGVAMLVALDHFVPPAVDRDSQAVAETLADQQPGTVRVHVFDRQGQLVGPISSARWQLTDRQWRERLTADEYRIARSRGTEAPFCGMLLDNRESGVYWCVCCRLPLFSSDAKYHSGTGWPSFFQPIARGNVREIRGFGGRNIGNEIRCARCDAHLGHVFNDGPEPTGHRYCLNSVALRFTPAGDTASLADPADEPSSTRAASSGAQTEEPVTPATAVLASGCFWCVETALAPLRGVANVESGYAGGSAETACKTREKHAALIGPRE